MVIKPSNNSFIITYNKEENTFYITCHIETSVEYILSFVDINSNLTLYVMKQTFNKDITYWVKLNSIFTYENLRGIVINFYNTNKEFLFNKKVIVNNNIEYNNNYIFYDNPFNAELYWYYVEFLYNDIYKYLEINNEDVVIDLGCHMGSFIMYCLQKKCNNIIALEPDVRSYNYLLKTFENNKNVHLLNCAVSTKNGSDSFYVENNGVGSSLLNGVNNYEFIKTVDTITIEKIMSDFNIDEIDLLKMDIEGTEFDVLENLNEGIYNKIKKMVVEFHYSDIEKINKLLLILNKYFTYIIKDNDYINRPQFTMFFFRKK